MLIYPQKAHVTAVGLPLALRQGYFLPRCNSPPVGLNFLYEVSRSHSDTPYSVGHFWASDQSVTETVTRQHRTLAREDTSIHPERFEPSIPASERPQIHLLDRAVTVVGQKSERATLLAESKQLIVYC